MKSQYRPSAHVFAIAAQPVAPFDIFLGQGVLGVDSAQMPIPQSAVKFETPVRPIGVFAVTVTQPLSAIPTIRKELGLIDIQKKPGGRTDAARSPDAGARCAAALLRNPEPAKLAARRTGECPAVSGGGADHVAVSWRSARCSMSNTSKRSSIWRRRSKACLDLEDQRETLKSKLNLKMGRAIQTEFTVPEIPAAADASLPASLEDLTEARQRALAHRPEARQAQLRIEQAESRDEHCQGRIQSFGRG